MSNPPPPQGPPPPPAPPTASESIRRYWRSVLSLTFTLLVIWLLAGPVLSILLAEQLNMFMLGGFPLGFWFAQQGSIIVFVVLIFVYAYKMNQLDRRCLAEIRAVKRRELEETK